MLELTSFWTTAMLLFIRLFIRPCKKTRREVTNFLLAVLLVVTIFQLLVSVVW